MHLLRAHNFRYNGVGQLTCVVCTVPIKTELLWTTHIQSRKHKDNVAAFKKQSLASSAVTTKHGPSQQVTNQLCCTCHVTRRAAMKVALFKRL